MAQVKLNPILTGLHGRIGNVVFYRRKDGDYVRTYVKGSNPDTEGQRTIRRTFADAVRSWQAMSDGEKYTFNKKAAYLNMSGYNLYISRYIKARISGMSNPGLKIETPGTMYSPFIQKSVTPVSPPFISSILENMSISGSG